MPLLHKAIVATKADTCKSNFKAAAKNVYLDVMLVLIEKLNPKANI